MQKHFEINYLSLRVSLISQQQAALSRLYIERRDRAVSSPNGQGCLCLLISER